MPDCVDTRVGGHCFMIASFKFDGTPVAERRVLPPLAIVKSPDEIEDFAASLSSAVSLTLVNSSSLRVAKKLSATALPSSCPSGSYCCGFGTSPAAVDIPCWRTGYRDPSDAAVCSSPWQGAAPVPCASLPAPALAPRARGTATVPRPPATRPGTGSSSSAGAVRRSPAGRPPHAAVRGPASSPPRRAGHGSASG